VRRALYLAAALLTAAPAARAAEACGKDCLTVSA